MTDQLEISRNNLLVCTLKPVAEGETFERTPPHVTIQRWFSLKPELRRAFLNSLSNLTYEVEPIKIEGGPEAFYGLNEDIRVRKLHVGIGALASLHLSTRDLVQRFHGEPDPKYGGDKYSPHVTYASGEGLGEGEKVTLSHLQLITRQTQHGERVVEKVFSLRKR